MEGMFAGQTDPTPYIAASYIIGVALLLWMPLSIFVTSKKLARMLDELNAFGKEGGRS